MDYLYPTPGTLSFTPGTTSGNSQCFNLATIQDDDVEGVHTLILTLVNATAGTLILGSSLVTITDDGIYGLIIRSVWDYCLFFPTQMWWGFL